MPVGRKFILTREILEAAWQLYKQGATIKEMMKQIGYGANAFYNNRREFEKYFARRKRQTPFFKKQLSSKQKEAEYKKQLMVRLAGLGHTKTEIAQILGVGPNAVYQWLKKDIELAQKVEVEADRWDNEIIFALKKKAMGMTNRSRSVTVVRDNKGRVLSTSTTDTTRHLSPNLGAIKFWLINRRGWITETEGAALNLDDKETEYDIRESLYYEDGADEHLNRQTR